MADHSSDQTTAGLLREAAAQIDNLRAHNTQLEAANDLLTEALGAEKIALALSQRSANTLHEAIIRHNMSAQEWEHTMTTSTQLATKSTLLDRLGDTMLDSPLLANGDIAAYVDCVAAEKKAAREAGKAEGKSLLEEDDFRSKEELIGALRLRAQDVEETERTNANIAKLSNDDTGQRFDEAMEKLGS
ncbi:hypothetical protein TI39_contig306g00013 [Zymoseptoria brevis]|uniref:Uncharacterized protein n=1 Tax=Zymoseptoria brevis TaxID=1047168 RepID=A0A0F4GXT5_9PEZI|nr:hypothetical protein TI39_contig306g00013 [Zymoseptoria brevis]